MAVIVGTSGWQYDDWAHRFYEGVPRRSWLEHYADHFPTVEVNNTFYRLPREETFVSWRERTPDGFLIAVKASRYLTHIRRLRDPVDPVHLLLERCRPLGDRLGPVLVQLPPDMKVALDRLDQTLAAFPRSVRVAVEPRHDSWFDDPTYALLAEHDAALVLADRRSHPITPVCRTASWGYVRFHEGATATPPGYGRTALRSWARRVQELWPGDEDVYAYFNNDPGGHAIVDAQRFTRLVS